MVSKTEKIIRAAFGCLPRPKKLPNMRGFTNYPHTSVIQDRFIAQSGTPTSDAIATPGASCCGDSADSCAISINPGFDGQPGGSRPIIGGSFAAPQRGGGISIIGRRVNPSVSMQRYSPSTAQTFAQNVGSSVDSFPLTVNVVIPVGVFGKGDTLVELPRPSRYVTIGSIGPTQAQQAYGIWVHLNQIGKQYPNAGSQTPTGDEPWYEIKSADIAGTTFSQGTELDFGCLAERFFLTIAGTPNTSFKITFLCSNSVRVNYRPAANTTG